MEDTLSLALPGSNMCNLKTFEYTSWQSKELRCDGSFLLESIIRTKIMSKRNTFLIQTYTHTHLDSIPSREQRPHRVISIVHISHYSVSISLTLCLNRSIEVCTQQESLFSNLHFFFLLSDRSRMF